MDNKKFVYLNDEKIPLQDKETISSFLKRNNVQFKGTAVVLNGKIIFREQYDSLELEPEDNIELISVVGGG